MLVTPAFTIIFTSDIGFCVLKLTAKYNKKIDITVIKHRLLLTEQPGLEHKWEFTVSILELRLNLLLA